MSFDPSTWIVTENEAEFPEGHIIYRATRSDLSPEYTRPPNGTDVSTILGTKVWTAATYFVTRSGSYIQSNRRVHWFEFCELPASHVEWESMGHVFPTLYPDMGSPQTIDNFPGGSHARAYVVPALVLYEYNRGGPASSWLTAAPIGNGAVTIASPSNVASVASVCAAAAPFEVKSTIAQHAATRFTGSDDLDYRVGQWLVGAFIAQNTINDAIEINLQDPYSLTYLVTASTPSHSLYDSWITDKKYLMTDRIFRRWRGDYFQRITRLVRAQ